MIPLEIKAGAPASSTGSSYANDVNKTGSVHSAGTRFLVLDIDLLH